MNYRIVHIDTNPADSQIAITKSDFLKIDASARFIDKVIDSVCCWKALKYNIEIFRTKLADRNSIWGYRDQDKHVYLNAMYANWLNSYYLWKCFNNHWKDTGFDEIIKSKRNQYVELRLLDELRNHISHEGFVITIISFDVLKEKTTFEIQPKTVLSYNTKLNSELKSYLHAMENQKKKIDANTLLDFSDTICKSIQCELLEKVFDQLKVAITTLRLYMPMDRIAFLNTYVEDDEHTICIPLGSKLKLLFELLLEIYPDYVNEIAFIADSEHF